MSGADDIDLISGMIRRLNQRQTIIVVHTDFHAIFVPQGRPAEPSVAPITTIH